MATRPKRATETSNAPEKLSSAVPSSESDGTPQMMDLGERTQIEREYVD